VVVCVTPKPSAVRPREEEQSKRPFHASLFLRSSSARFTYYLSAPRSFTPSSPFPTSQVRTWPQVEGTLRKARLVAVDMPAHHLRDAPSRGYRLARYCRVRSRAGADVSE